MAGESLTSCLRCTGDIRHAICPKQIQLIARINEVRVIEVWVALPQIGPAPGSLRNNAEMSQSVSPACTI
ncbi:MAG: hypothetical protein CM15mP74_13720 [Halieaceae bacterium]|nr:MAG: hypothetical protein CM15mP74_13720 [Halieaceae bacterium]